MKKLLIVVNVDWAFITHRFGVAEKALEANWEVYVAAQETGRSNEIVSKGIHFIDLPLSRSGTNPIEELKTLISFRKLYKSIKPDVVHHVSLKPVIYGSLMAKWLKINGVLNAVSGLGYNFTEERQGFVQKVMISLMRRGFKRKNVAFIFQNQDDYKELNSFGVLDSRNSINFIKGSGVDLSRFKQTALPNGAKVKILFPTRMLWDKGVSELRKATEILKNKYSNKIVFILAGLADEGNKAGVSADYLEGWSDNDYVKWIGYHKDMVGVYNDSDIVILPTYREGMPKSLIEACAVGRPIITTDAIGSRECVDEGVNGLKVPVKSTVELSEAISKLVDNEAARVKMGNESRIKAEKEFDQNGVFSKHLEIYETLLKAKK